MGERSRWKHEAGTGKKEETAAIRRDDAEAPLRHAVISRRMPRRPAESRNVPGTGAGGGLPEQDREKICRREMKLTVFLSSGPPAA